MREHGTQSDYEIRLPVRNEVNGVVTGAVVQARVHRVAIGVVDQAGERPDQS